MARLARSTVLGYPHRVVQRGCHDQTVFESDEDRLRYLDWLAQYAERYGVDIWAYCLMPSHVHFICVPKMEGAVARAFNATHMRYAQSFNEPRAETGPPTRPPFTPCAHDDPRAP